MILQVFKISENKKNVPAMNEMGKIAEATNLEYRTFQEFSINILV